jgi:hypothetical protein
VQPVLCVRESCFLVDCESLGGLVLVFFALRYPESKQASKEVMMEIQDEKTGTAVAFIISKDSVTHNPNPPKSLPIPSSTT